eukprot:365466-Chlamydomonas_euryale.AAC.4
MADRLKCRAQHLHVRAVPGRCHQGSLPRPCLYHVSSQVRRAQRRHMACMHCALARPWPGNMQWQPPMRSVACPLTDVGGGAARWACGSGSPMVQCDATQS